MIFLLQTYKHDIDKARVTVERIKHFYPKHKILVVYDGIKDNIPNCYQIYRERLYHQNNGGKPTQHCLGQSLKASKFNYLIKLEPDTWINNYYDLSKLNPDFLHCNYDNNHIYGGLVIYPYNIAKKIYESGLLLNNCYKEHFYNYGNKKLNQKISCQDLIIFDVCKRLNIRLKPVKYFADIRLNKIERLNNKNISFYHSW